MIVFDLHCADGHRFEGWFGSSSEYDAQSQRGLIACPQCGSASVEKAPMAPAVPAKGNRQAVRSPVTQEAEVLQPVTNMPIPPEVEKALKALARAQAKALEKSTWVGDKFAESSRAMHYGEREAEAIHGEASIDEARALIEEGVAVAPLPFPVAPPDKLN